MRAQKHYVTKAHIGTKSKKTSKRIMYKYHARVGYMCRRNTDSAVLADWP